MAAAGEMSLAEIAEGAKGGRFTTEARSSLRMVLDRIYRILPDRISR
jgi:hypothetical protein